MVVVDFKSSAAMVYTFVAVSVISTVQMVNRVKAKGCESVHYYFNVVQVT